MSSLHLTFHCSYYTISTVTITTSNTSYKKIDSYVMDHSTWNYIKTVHLLPQCITATCSQCRNKQLIVTVNAEGRQLCCGKLDQCTWTVVGRQTENMYMDRQHLCTVFMGLCLILLSPAITNHHWTRKLCSWETQRCHWNLSWRFADSDRIYVNRSEFIWSFAKLSIVTKNRIAMCKSAIHTLSGMMTIILYYSTSLFNLCNWCCHGWLCGAVVECWFLNGKLYLSCTRPTANRWPLTWVNRTL